MSTQLADDEKKAETLIECLQKREIDYSLLLWLQLPDSMIEKNPVLKTIKQIVYEDFGVTNMRHHFFETVESYIVSNGISDITPLSFVCARNKDDLHKEYQKKKAAWGLHVPFCFQTYGSEFVGSVFFITRTWQDGLIRLLQILKDGNVSYCINSKHYSNHACGAIEHIVDESSLSYAFFDCELNTYQCEGRVSVQQIRDCVANFPAIMGGLFLEAGVVDTESVVKFIVKDKCRHVGKDLKISYHFCSSIAATKSLHEGAMNKVLAPHMKWMEYVGNCIKHCPKDKNKTLTLIPTEKLCNPQDPQSVLMFLDTKALPGGPNGFTTAFSRKKTGDSYPILSYQETVCLGTTLERDACKFQVPHDPNASHIAESDLLEIFRQCCYTVPKMDTMAYSDEFMDFIKKKVPPRN